MPLSRKNTSAKNFPIHPKCNRTVFGGGIESKNFQVIKFIEFQNFSKFNDIYFSVNICKKFIVYLIVAVIC